VIVEQAKEAIEAHIETRWLQKIHLKGLEADSTGFNLGANIAI
jgi:hypothetical protein